MGYMESYKAWCANEYFDEATRAELKSIEGNEKEIELSLIHIYMLVADRMQSGNYSFNYATAGAKIWTGIITFVVAGTIVFTVAAMLPLIHVKGDFIMENNRLTVEGGGYKITFDKESIQRAEPVSYTHLDVYKRQIRSF